MASWVEKIVGIESPVHVDEVVRRIRDAAGVQRAGTRVREAVGNAIRHCVQRGTVAVRGEFLWAPGMTTPTVRDRSGLPDSSRRLELIAPEEVQALAEELVRRAFSIEAVELVAEIARLLGFERVTPEMRSRLSRDLAALVASGRLVSDGAVLRPSDSGMSRGER